MKRGFWIALLLLGLVSASPASAIFLSCADICTCAVTCSRPCRDTPTSPYTNCGATGDCIGGSGCTIAAAEVTEPTFFAPASDSPAVCSEEQPAPPAAAEPAK